MTFKLRRNTSSSTQINNQNEAQKTPVKCMGIHLDRGIMW